MTKLEDNTAFLPFFLTEPIYVILEAEALPTEPASIIPKTASISVDPEPIIPKFLGDNQQEILIVVHEVGEEFLSEGNKAFLEKVLQAIGLSWADVAVFNWASPPSNNSTMLESLSQIPFRQCLALGPLPPDWKPNAHFKHYQVTRDALERPLLWADALSDLADDLEKKRRLWQGLQSLFG